MLVVVSLWAISRTVASGYGMRIGDGEERRGSYEEGRWKKKKKKKEASANFNFFWLGSKARFVEKEPHTLQGDSRGQGLRIGLNLTVMKQMPGGLMPDKLYPPTQRPQLIASLSTRRCAKSSIGFYCPKNNTYLQRTKGTGRRFYCKMSQLCRGVVHRPKDLQQHRQLNTLIH